MSSHSYIDVGTYIEMDTLYDRVSEAVRQSSLSEYTWGVFTRNDNSVLVEKSPHGELYIWAEKTRIVVRHCPDDFMWWASFVIMNELSLHFRSAWICNEYDESEKWRGRPGKYSSYEKWVSKRYMPIRNWLWRWVAKRALLAYAPRKDNL